MSPKLKTFWQNGGHVKLLLWLIFITVSFLLSTGWKARGYANRLDALEKTALTETSPTIKAMSDNIVKICGRVGMKKDEISLSSDYQKNK